jgi:hypothetical protein
MKIILIKTMTTRRLMMFGQLEETKRPNLLVKSTLLFPSECCVYRLQSLSIELQLHHNLTTAHTIMTSLMIPGRSGRKEEETQLMPRPCLCEISVLPLVSTSQVALCGSAHKRLFLYHIPADHNSRSSYKCSFRMRLT